MAGRWLLGALAALAWTGVAAGDWPAWRGPGQTGAATDGGERLIDDPARARLVWTSTDPIPGARVADGRKVVPRTDGPGGISGGFASPVLAGGRLYIYYYIPNGQGEDYDHELFKRHQAGGFGKEKWWIDCDDVIHCFDAATGRTLWKRAFAGKGMNYNLFNKGGPCNLTPAVAGGKVFAIGSAGKVYCVDAASGQPVWDSDVGERYRIQEKLRAVCKQQKRIPQYNRDMSSTPVVADGVVVCSDFLGYKVQQPVREFNWENGCGLVGLDAATGKRLWHLPRTLSNWASPVRWESGGREYILSGNSEGKVVCVEPRTGKALWEAATGTSQDTLCAAAEHMINRDGESIACWRITPQGASRLWRLPGALGKATTIPAIYKGHVYCGFKSGKMMCIELATGKVAGEAAVAAGSFLVAMDGRVFADAELGHDGNRVYMLDADPKSFRQLGGVWAAPNATVYMDPLTPACSGGRMYLRTEADRLACYDLREGKAHAQPQNAAGGGSGPDKPATGKSAPKAAPKGASPVPGPGAAPRHPLDDL